MVICVCNAIRDKDVREAVRNGAQGARCVYRQFGHKPKCAQCVSHMDSIVSAERNAA